MPQYCDCGFVLPRVRRCAALRCGCCVTAQRCVRLCSRLIVRVCASRCVVYTRALPPRCSGGAALRVCCRWWWQRRRSLAVHVAHECVPCFVIVHVAVAVSHCCSVRAGSDCDTVLQVLCVPAGVAALAGAARGRGRVFNAAPPLCVTTMVPSVLSVECSGVCSCGAVCLGVCVYHSMLLFDFRERQCAVVSVLCRCVAVSLCSCVWHCAALDGRCGCQWQ